MSLWWCCSSDCGAGEIPLDDGPSSSQDCPAPGPRERIDPLKLARSEVTEFLDVISKGYGSRFWSAFDSVGIESENDLMALQSETKQELAEAATQPWGFPLSASPHRHTSDWATSCRL